MSFDAQRVPGGYYHRAETENIPPKALQDPRGSESGGTGTAEKVARRKGVNKKQRFNERMKERGLKRVEEWIPVEDVQRFRNYAATLREKQQP